MKLILTVLITCCTLTMVSAQRMSYGDKDAGKKVKASKIQLSLDTSVDVYNDTLELTEEQKNQVDKLLVKVRGTNETWEQRKKRFDHQIKVILSEAQFERYRALQ